MSTSKNNIEPQQLPSNQGTDEGGRTKSARKKRPLPRVLIGAAIMLAVLILITQTPWARERARSLIETQIESSLAADIQIAELTGNLISGMELHQFAVQTNDASVDVVVESIALEYNLLDLLFGRRKLRELSVYGITGTLIQRADSSWGLTQMLDRDETDENQNERSSVDVARLSLDQTDIHAHFFSPEKDSILTIDSLTVRLSELQIGESFSVQVDTASGAFTPFNRDAVRWAIGGYAREGVLGLSQVTLHSDLSQLSGHGELSLPFSSAAPSQPRAFELQASPLALADLSPFFPAIDPSSTIDFSVLVQQTSEKLRGELDATLNETGHLSLVADMLYTSDSTHSYQLDGSLANVNMSALSTVIFPDKEISGSVAVDLTGPTGEVLSGRVEAMLSSLPVSGFDFANLAIEADVDESRAQILSTGILDNADFELSGTAHPFADVVSYDVRLAIDELPARVLMRDGSSTGSVSGDIQITGSGLDLDDADVEASLNLASSTINAANIRSGQGNLHLGGRTLAFDGSVYTDEGLASIKGTANVGSAIEFAITQGSLSGLDLFAFVRQEGHSSFSGAFAAEGRIEEPSLNEIDLDVDLYDSFVDRARITNAQVTMGLSGGDLTSTGTIETDENSRAEFEALLQVDDSNLPFELKRLSFENLNVAGLSDSDGIASSLTGSIEVSGNFPTVSEATLTGLVTIAEPSSINGIPVSGSIGIKLDSDTVQLDTDITTSSGDFHGPVSVETVSSNPSIQFSGLQFSDINLAAFTSKTLLESALTGVATARIAPLDLARLEGEIELSLSASRINSSVIPDGNIHIDLSPSVSEYETNISIGQGRLDLSGSIKLQNDRHAFSIHGAIVDVDVASALGMDSFRSNVSLGFDHLMRTDSRGQMVHVGNIHSAGSTFHDVEVDSLGLAYELTDSTLTLSDVIVSSNALEMSGGGHVSLSATDSSASRIVLPGRVVSLEPVEAFFGTSEAYVGDNSFVLVLASNQDLIELDAAVTAYDLGFDNSHALSANVSTSASLTHQFDLVAASGYLETGFVALPRIGIETSRVDLSLADSVVDIRSTISFDQSRSLAMEGRYNLRSDPPELHLDRLDIELPPSSWALARRATIRTSDLLAVDELVMQSDSQYVVVESDTFEGTSSGSLSISNTEIGPFAALLGYDDLQGRLSSTVQFDRVDNVTSYDGNIDFSIRSDGEDLAQLSAKIEGTDTGVSVDANIAPAQSPVIAVSGYYPFAPVGNDQTVDARPFDISVSADSSSIAWVQPFLDREIFDDVDGALSARVRISGTTEEPRLAGFFDLNDGLIHFPRYNVQLGLNQLNSRFRGTSLLIENGRIESGNGNLDLSGSIDFQSIRNAAFDLTGILDRFRIAENDEYHATISGDVNLSGAVFSPSLSGRIRTLNTDMYVSGSREEDLEFVELTDEDERMLEREFAYRIAPVDTSSLQLYKSLALDLAVSLERDTWLRRKKNPEMAIELTGNVDVQKDKGSNKLSVFRSIEILPQRSFIEQFGKRFSIDRGTIRFSGPLEEMDMDISASYEVPSRLNPGEPEATITLALSGRMEDLQFELGSDPTMENTDIISYLATGRPASQSLTLSSFGPDQSSIFGLAAGQLTGLIEGLAGEGLGLDVIEIRQDGLRGTQLTAGKYVSPRLYVGVSHPISFGGGTNVGSQQAREIAIEYAVFKMLVLQVIQNTSSSALKLNLTGRYAY